MAQHRHKREPDARRLKALAASRAVRIAAGTALAGTLPIVALGVAAADRPTPATLVADQSSAVTLDPLRYDSAPVSRTFDRAAQRDAQGYAQVNSQQDLAAQAATMRAVKRAHVRKWTTTDLNLWTSPSQAADQVGLLSSGKRVLITGRVEDGRVELVVDGKSRWVTAGYLATDKPDSVTAAAGLSMAPCPDPSVEYRLTAAAVYVYRSVCHAFPQITSYGGWDAHGEHASGKAIDIMTSDVTLGNAIAAFLQQHASELHLYDILWRQHIWTPVRASEGWRLFADRGSPTANHMDHVHVSVY